MVEQRKLPLEEEQTRLKLAIGPNEDDAQEASIPSTDDTLMSGIEEEPLSVGAHLRLERERQGLSLHDVAEKLRIRAIQLQALEDGEYDSLPGQTFAIGFLRSYATTLGLDAVAVVDLYKRETGAGTRGPDLAFPEPTSEGRMPGVSLMIASMVVALLLFSGWYFYLEDNSIELEIVQELPERLMEKITETMDDVAATNAPLSSNDTPADPTDLNVTTPKPTLLSETETPDNENSQVSQGNEAVEGTGASNMDEPQRIVSEGEDAISQPVTSEAETVQGGIEAPLANVTEAPSQALKETMPAAPADTAPVSNSEATTVDATSQTTAAKTAPKNTLGTAGAEPTESAVPFSDRSFVEETETKQDQDNFQQLTLNTDPETNRIEVSPEGDEPVTLGVENAEARLVLVARQESWVQIIADDGETVLDRIMMAGDTFMLPNRSDLKLNTANASGLEVRLDGKLLGALGNYGEIIRNMPMKPEDLTAKFSNRN